MCEIGRLGGGAFLIFDALITNQTGRRGCVYDRDVQLHYPAGGNSAQTNLPNRTTGTSNVVAELRRIEPAYNGIEELKPQQLTGNFCLNAGQTRPTFLIYNVPEGWEAATLLIGGTQTVNLCLARTEKVLNGFREIEAHTACHFTFDWESVGEVQLLPSEGFFFAAEMPASNCDSLTPFTVSRGAEVQQDKQPATRIQVNNNWEDLARSLVGSITLQLPFVQVDLIRLVESQHKITNGQRITITSTLSRTVPSGMDAKYRFVWREYRMDGFLIVNMQADAGYTIHSVRVPYSIYGKVRPSVEVIYERLCPTPTAAP